MLELQRKKLEFKLDDVIYRLDYPSVKKMTEYASKLDKADDKLNAIVDFLSGLGLDRKVSEDMEISHLTSIIKALTEEKK